MTDSKKKVPDLHVGKVISELGGDELNLLFSLIQKSGKLPEAKRLLKDRDPNTVARAFLVIQALIVRDKKEPPPDDEANRIAEIARYSATTKYVQDMFTRFTIWGLSQQKPIADNPSSIKKRTIKHVSAGDLESQLGWSRKIHLDSLAKDAQKLRGRIVNPNRSMRIFNEREEGKSIWFYQGFDWRLAPDDWFGVVAPLFEFAEWWIPNFENLKSHLANSSFLKHYIELADETAELEFKINEFANGLKTEDPFWYSKWDEFKDNMGIFFVDGRQFKPDIIPSHDVIQQLIEDFSNLGNFFNETATRLKEYYPDLDKKCETIEILLQNVYDDLDQDCIARDIENGECPRCSHKQLSK